MLQRQTERSTVRLAHPADRRSFLGHLQEDLPRRAVWVEPNRQIALVVPDAKLMRHRIARTWEDMPMLYTAPDRCGIAQLNSKGIVIRRNHRFQNFMQRSLVKIGVVMENQSVFVGGGAPILSTLATSTVQHPHWESSVNPGWA